MMSANALVTARIDENVKVEAGKVLASMGLTISEVMRMTLTKIANEKSYSFDYQPNARTAQDLTMAKNGEGSNYFDNVNDALAWLEK